MAKPPNTFPFETAAIQVDQPLGTFYVASIPARVLRQITFSERARISYNPKQSGYSVEGSQREAKAKREKEIGRYLQTVDAAFPNSIILACNYNQDGEFEESEETRWRLKKSSPSDNGCLKLTIPTDQKLAAIVDGQHRLNGFDYAPDRQDMQLLCAIYFDLPIQLQAYIFATINFNQKSVDRSLAFELFGFRLEDEEPRSWPPDKLAVYLCRKLNTDEESPFQGHIRVAPVSDDLNEIIEPSFEWKVSTATVVDGISKLFSSNHKRDRDLMNTVALSSGRNREMLTDDSSPLRGLFKDVNDKAIYLCILNFFKAVEKLFWIDESGPTFLKKTVGIQAFFQVLRGIMKSFEQDRDVSIAFYSEKLSPSSTIDFNNLFFRQASGGGMTRIRNAIEYAIGLKELTDLPASDQPTYQELVVKPAEE